MNTILRVLLLFFLLTSSVWSADFWLPPVIEVTPSGDLAHSLPFPDSLGQGAIGRRTGAGFFPIATGNLSKFKRIFVEEGVRKSGRQRAVSTFKNLINTQGNRLVRVNNPEGYRILQENFGALSLSIGLSVGPATWGLVDFKIGVGGAVGSGWSSSRWTRTHREADQLGDPKIPLTLSEIKRNWMPGDSLSFNRSFTLTVNMSAGTGPLMIGVAGGISTDWNVLLKFPKKANRGIVKVAYATGDTKSAVLYGSAAVANVSLEKIWGKSKSIVYKFDLNNGKELNLSKLEITRQFNKMPGDSKNKIPLGVKETFNKDSLKQDILEVSAKEAYQLAIQGDLILADILSRHPGYGVERIFEQENKTSAVNKKASFSIPFIVTASYKQGKAYTVSHSKDLGSGEIGMSYMGVYSKDHFTSGIASKNLGRSVVFTGNFQQIYTEKGGFLKRKLRRYSANVKYLYRKDKTTDEEFIRELRDLRYRVGQMKNLKVQIPKGQIGSANLEFDVSISDVAVDHMMEFARKTPLQRFTKYGLDYFDGFLNHHKDLKRQATGETDNSQLAEEVICVFYTATRRGCYGNIRSEITKHMARAHVALLKMKEYKDDVQIDEFINAFVDFGAAFIKNRFIFKTILRGMTGELEYCSRGNACQRKEIFDVKKRTVGTILVPPQGALAQIRKARPIEMVLHIQGTKISPYKKVVYSYK